MEARIAKLHLKFAEKTWNETFQLVRRCMDKPKDKSKLCMPLVRSLERLQQVVKVTSMNAMKSRLEVIAKRQGVPMDSNSLVDMINDGRIGFVIPGKEDCPLTIQFYTPPTDERKPSDMQALVQAAQVAVGVSDVTRKLQMASVLPQPPQLDPHGRLVFLPSSKAPHQSFAACFLLKLQPPLPMTSSFVSKLSQMTDVAIPDVDLQWAPLPKLLMSRSPSSNSPEETLDEQDTVFTVPLPGGVMHRYVLAAAAWEVPAQRAAVVTSVPFTHPAHVPALLALLRHQCAINTLLRSCIASQYDRAGLVCELHFEVLPESETSFSVTFHRPHKDSLAVLLVNVWDSHRITCTLFGPETGNPSLNEYLSTVMKRFMSVPVTLQALHGKLKEISLRSTFFQPPPPPPPPGHRRGPK
ncbi:mediator of RNA polymerase II transcription subunit 1-like isoform X2 [Clinocottus analis]|uniref:mediator of RNA polymerase II transcription subunit 1-like isoform X2 n=1 Tax=Clinocottus analis TaxID=304258 RepID=UPI0035C207DA